ncbi:MAG TPA: hypothetical protein VND80_03225 [Steroidobacteraceae bacterium]|nr:hypothetical protein [Steroidobacteraceae bacterium]
MRVLGIVLAATLAGASAFAAPAKPAAAGWRPRWSAAAVAALTARGGDDSLAMAALLDRGADALALAGRAAQLAPDDSAIVWINLRVCALTPGCDIRGDATELRWLDPDNSAAWLPTLAAALHDQDSVETDRVLAHMARGTDVDFYWNPIVVRMFDALRAVADRVPGRAIDSDAATLAAIERLAAAQIVPPLAPLTDACRRAKAGTPRRLSCGTIAQLLQRADTVSAQYAGFAVARRFAPFESREYYALGERRRVLEWRVATAARFDKPLLPWLKSAHARWRIARMRKLARQEDVILAVLRSHGMPIDPPPPPPPPTPPPAPPEPLHMRPR